MNGPAAGSAAFPISGRGQAHVPSEVLGKRALIAETKVEGDLRNGFVSGPKHFTCRLDAGLDKEGSWIGAEDFTKTPIELSNRHSRSFGEVSEVDGLVKMFSQKGDSPVDLLVGDKGRFSSRVTLHSAHHPDNGTITPHDWKLVGEIPIRKPLTIEKQLDDLQLWLSGGDHLLVVFAKLAGELLGEKFEVGFSNHPCFALCSESFPERAIRRHKAKIAVLCKKGNAGKVIKKHLEVARGRDLEKKLGLEVFRGSHKNSADYVMAETSQGTGMGGMAIRLRYSFLCNHLNGINVGVAVSALVTDHHGSGFACLEVKNAQSVEPFRKRRSDSLIHQDDLFTVG